jgi:Trk K+ transport system NAD-binding subunit
VRFASTIAAVLDRPVRVTLALGLVLLAISALVLHFGFHRPHGHADLSLLDSIYFTVETVATVGFGDFSFSNQPSWVEAFGIFLIFAGTTLVATLLALLTNALVSRRIAQSFGEGQIPGMSGHVVLVGLGAVGMRVVEGLLEQRAQVVVVERHVNSPFLGRARSLGVPVVLGDATLDQTLDAVNLETAAGVAVLTSDDMTNIETGLAVRDRLGERWLDVPVVLRVFDRQLGHRLEASFRFRHVWSTSAIAAPWFVGAALGMEVLFTFYVGNHPFLLARLRVSAGGGLDGLAMRELPGRIRVVAIRRAQTPEELEHPPRRDTRLAPGDDAYLAGPYEELLKVLRHDRSPARGDSGSGDSGGTGGDGDSDGTS